MTQEHPITPPPELVDKWREDWRKADVKPDVYSNFIATQAARWGADQELEACCECIERLAHGTDAILADLRAARRPKPPNLKEQALAELELLRGDAYNHGLGFDAPAIRRALESLPD